MELIALGGDGFQSHYFRPQPLDLVGGFAHRGPGVQVNRNAGGLLSQPHHYVFRFLDHGSPSSCTEPFGYQPAYPIGLGSVIVLASLVVIFHLYGLFPSR